MPFPALSVVVPVWNDAKRIGLCLRALQQQTVSPKCYEIVVVDNGSTDNSVDIVRSFTDIRLVIEPLPGSYAARNKGLSEAAGDLVAFTDSDCIPHPTWLEKAFEVVKENSGFGIVAGRIEFF